MSAHDAIVDFVAFMEANNVVPIEPIAQRLASGSLIRFRCEGDGKGRQNGWAILYLDERPAGAFGNYKANTGTLKWKSGADRPILSQSERDALNAEWRAASDRRIQEQQNNSRQAALAASDMWQRAVPATLDHAYITNKMLDPMPLKMLGDELLIPMFADDGCLWNLQRIKHDGQKRFLKGGRVDDLFTFVGDVTPNTTEAVIVEGYATGDSVHQSVGLPVIVSFSAKNMIRVARLFYKHRPEITYTIFGYDDRATAMKAPNFKNPGRESAIAAANEIGARLVFPIGERVA